MYYIEETDNELIKYEVELDTEKLMKLRKEIVDQCSTIEHIKNQVEGLLEHSFFEGRDIRNYHERRIGRKEYFDAPDKDVYEIEYDLYIHTSLAHYIDKLLKGDTSIINSLINYCPSIEPEVLLRKLGEAFKNNLINSLTKSLDDIEMDALKQNIDNVKTVKKDIELNKNQVSDAMFYDDVIKCITLKEVNRIDKDAIKRVEEFQDISYTKKNK